MKLNRTLDSPEQGRSVHQNIFLRQSETEGWNFEMNMSKMSILTSKLAIFCVKVTISTDQRM